MNQLVAATNHNVPDGTEVDFLGTKGSFANFLKAMIGLQLGIVTRFEEYEFNGEKKKTLRLKGMKAVAPVAAEEKPF